MLKQWCKEYHIKKSIAILPVFLCRFENIYYFCRHNKKSTFNTHVTILSLSMRTNCVAASFMLY